MFYISSSANFHEGIIKEIHVNAVYRDLGENEIYSKTFEEDLDKELAKVRREITDYRTAAIIAKMAREKRDAAAALSDDAVPPISKKKDPDRPEVEAAPQTAPQTS